MPWKKVRKRGWGREQVPVINRAVRMRKGCGRQAPVGRALWAKGTTGTRASLGGSTGQGLGGGVGLQAGRHLLIHPVRHSGRLRGSPVCWVLPGLVCGGGNRCQ